MRSLATSDRPAARALARAIELMSTTAQARDFLRILHRMGASTTSIVPAVRDSPNFEQRRFATDEPSLRPRVRAQTSALLAAIRVHGRGRPVGPVPMVRPAPPQTPGGLAVTWYGHATIVLELDGARFLLDPVFSERVSPSTRFGPKRLHPVPGEIEQIPTIDAVVISHDHYDHLDEPSIVMLEHTHRPRYVVPLGVNLHLLAWGVPTERITALDWRESTEVAGVRLTCTEARHNSGRGLVDSQTLWAGWALRGPRHAVFFAGDSGTSKCFARIGADLGPFDLTMLPVGAYDMFWPDLHMDPEQAVEAHCDLTAAVSAPAKPAVLLPVHWATFNLAMHWWAEPMRRVRLAAAEVDVPIISPRLGERVDLTAGAPEALAESFSDPWWQACSAEADHD